MHILDHFVNSSLDIKDIELLKQYINFCIDNNQNTHIKHKTANHHILPKADSCFPEFSNLKTHSWNSTILTHQNHYKAHLILATAISNYSIISAWWAMNNKDAVLRNIDVTIESQLYEDLLTEKSKLFSIESQTIEENGKSKAQNGAAKGAKTAKTTILPNGNTIAKERGLDAAHTRKTTILSNGLSVDEDNGQKIKAKRLENDSYRFGEDHGRCQKIKVTDENNNVKLCGYVDMRKWCKENGIPFREFYNSLRVGNSMYETSTNRQLKNAENIGHIKFLGWRVTYV